jgi:hypothetical protein
MYAMKRIKRTALLHAIPCSFASPAAIGTVPADPVAVGEAPIVSMIGDSIARGSALTMRRQENALLDWMMFAAIVADAGMGMSCATCT